MRRCSPPRSRRLRGCCSGRSACRTPAARERHPRAAAAAPPARRRGTAADRRARRQPDGGPRPAPAESYPTLLQQTARRRRVPLRRRQRRRVRRHVGGRPLPARLGARRRRARADCRPRRQRRAARAAGRRVEAEPVAHHRAGAGRGTSGCCWPAWKRRRTSAATTSSHSIRCTRRSPGSISVPLVPFLLEGVAADPALNQRDGIHPTAEGARMVADNVWTALKPLVEDDSRERPGRKAPPGHDRASRRFENGDERRRTAHHPAPAVPARRRRASSCRSSGRRAAANPRCSA